MSTPVPNVADVTQQFLAFRPPESVSSTSSNAITTGAPGGATMNIRARMLDFSAQKQYHPDIGGGRTVAQQQQPTPTSGAAVTPGLLGMGGKRSAEKKRGMGAHVPPGGVATAAGLRNSEPGVFGQQFATAGPSPDMDRHHAAFQRLSLGGAHGQGGQRSYSVPRFDLNISPPTAIDAGQAVASSERFAKGQSGNRRTRSDLLSGARQSYAKRSFGASLSGSDHASGRDNSGRESSSPPSAFRLAVPSVRHRHLDDNQSRKKSRKIQRLSPSHDNPHRAAAEAAVTFSKKIALKTPFHFWDNMAVAAAVPDDFAQLGQKKQPPRLFINTSNLGGSGTNGPGSADGALFTPTLASPTVFSFSYTFPPSMEAKSRAVSMAAAKVAAANAAANRQSVQQRLRSQDASPRGVPQSGATASSDVQVEDSMRSCETPPPSQPQMGLGGGDDDDAAMNDASGGVGNREEEALAKRSPSSFARFLLSPDPTAFAESTSLSARPHGRTPFKSKACPPTPIRNGHMPRPDRLARTSSLYDNKILLMLQRFDVDDSQEGLSRTRHIFEEKFETLSHKGQGSFFDVFCVREKSTGNVYAVKRSLKPFRSRREREEYLKEVKLVSLYVPHHQNIVRYFSAWQQDQHFFVQMESCQCNLYEFVERLQADYQMRHPQCMSDDAGGGVGSGSGSGSALHKRIVDVEFLTKCTIQLARALHHLHKANLLHLDIKPANVLVTYDGILKLGDFGQATLKDNFRDGREGDCQYMAPELLGVNAVATPAADVLSLGLLLFELAANVQLPHSGELWHAIRSGGARVYMQNAGVAPAFVDLICAMLERDPSKRLTTSQILRQLDIDFMDDIVEKF